MRHYTQEDGRNPWMEKDIEDLKMAYKRYPYQIPQYLLQKHVHGGCHTKAFRLGIAKGVRNPGVDLSSLTREEIGYIAGFMDGEGSICFCLGKSMRPTIQFPNTNKEVIDWLLKKLTVGGLSITVREKKNPKWKTLYQIHIGGVKNVYDILLKIEPYLIIKKDKAQQAIRELKGRYNLN